MAENFPVVSRLEWSNHARRNDLCWLEVMHKHADHRLGSQLKDIRIVRCLRTMQECQSTGSFIAFQHSGPVISDISALHVAQRFLGTQQSIGLRCHNRRCIRILPMGLTVAVQNSQARSHYSLYACCSPIVYSVYL